MTPEDQTLSLKQAKKESVNHPDKVFVVDNGNIVFRGLSFENKEEFDKFLKASQKHNWLLKLFSFFTPKKKS